MAKKPEKTPKATATRSRRVIRAEQDHPAGYYLGREVKDATAGLTGICTGVSRQANGNVMVALQPKAEAGKAPEALLIDEQSIDIAGPGVSDRLRLGNMAEREFEIGDWVEHKVAPWRGVVAAIHWHLNGCISYVAISGALDDRGRVSVQSFLSHEVKAGGGPAVEFFDPRKGVLQTGGPSMPAPAGYR